MTVTMSGWGFILVALLLPSLSVRPYAQSLTETAIRVPPPSDVGAPPADATRGASGLFWKVLRPGTGGQRPQGRDQVTVQYTIWTPDGRTLDSTQSPRQPAVLALDLTIEGLRKGLEQMVVGEERRLWVSEDHAYGGHADRPRGAMVIDVELLAIAPSAVAVPVDVETPPSGATRTRSGLAYQILQRGPGTDHPLPHGFATFHYSGWASDGDLFDSSALRGEPVTFRVDTVLPGLSEGLQLMVPGEKARFWIPERLAYQGLAPPHGPLVFDVELVSVKQIAHVTGPPGTVTIESNVPLSSFFLIRPDGSRFGWTGPHTFAGQPPGQYEIEPDVVAGYTSTIDISPPDMVLQPGGTLTITITYNKRRP